MSRFEARDLWGTMRHELLVRDRLLELLAEGPMTLPEVAERMGERPLEVVHWVMTLRRYGLVVEQGEEDDDGYYAYGLVHDASEGSDG